ncbi:MAG: glutathione S-transferase family protein [Alphaproteobacteria bacterium]
MLTLYHWEPNANSGKPIQTLKEKGVPFETHWIDMMKNDQHKPEYLKINPNGTIPAMVHDGLMLFESSAIMEYVDEAFDGPPLSPKDPEGRWRMRWWMKFIDQYYAPSVSKGAWSGRGAVQRTPQETEALKQRIEAIPLKERREAWTKAYFGGFAPGELEEAARAARYGIGLMEDHLSRQKWLAGDMFSLADICAFNTVYTSPTRPQMGVNDKATPHLMEWLRKIYERPATIDSWNMGRAFTAERLAHLKRPS